MLKHTLNSICVTALISAVTAANAADIFSDSFDTPQPEWSFVSPSSGYLGELNNNVNVSSVTLTLNVASPTLVDIRFDLLGFRSLDAGASCCIDTLTFAANGVVQLTGIYSHDPLMNRLLTNPSGATVTQLWVNTPPLGVGTANSGHFFTVPNVPLGLGINTFEWSYSPLQSLDDEAWGLDNVRVTAVPESTTFMLLLGGLAIVALYPRSRASQRAA
jgi:hypothetical protein